MGWLIWGLTVSLIICIGLHVNAQKADCNRPCPPNVIIEDGVMVTTSGVDEVCREQKRRCRECLKNPDQDGCISLLNSFKDLGFFQDLGVEKPQSCSQEDPENDSCDIVPPPGRKKRGIEDFHRKYVWNQERLRKNSQCCVTTKRSIYYVTHCGPNCYPVYCPLAGGHQFIDEVVCNVTNDDQRRQYSVYKFSQPKSGPCRKENGKECQIGKTLRAYAVTNVPPQGWWGHCLYTWIPIWFKPVVVPTHCFCGA